MAGNRKSLRRKGQNTLESSQSASAEVPLRTGESELSNGPPPIADSKGVRIEQDGKLDTKDNSCKGVPPVDDPPSAVETSDICMNFNKGRCHFGSRCARRHIRVSDAGLREIEARTKCKFRSKDECTYSCCLRIHAPEEECTNAQVPISSAHFGKHRAGSLLIPNDNSDTPGNQSVSNNGMFFDEEDRMVVRLPPSRKSCKASCKFKRNCTLLAFPSYMMLYSDDLANVSNLGASDGGQSCVPLLLSDVGSQSPTVVVRIRRSISETTHDSSDGSVEDARGESYSTGCTFCVLGLCNGERCERPGASSAIAASNKMACVEELDYAPAAKQPCTDLNVTLFSRMKVTIGPGMQVTKVATADESSSILIGNIPSFVLEDDIRDICVRFGIVNSVRMVSGDRQKNLGDPLAAKVDFETIEQAQKAVGKLNGAKHFFSVLRVHLCLPGWGGDPAVGVLSNSLVRLDVPAPGRTVYLGYPSLKDAKLMTESLHGSYVRGNTISATIYEGVPRIGECTVKVECLPDDTCDEEIRVLSRSDGPILLGRLIYSSLSDAMSTFRPYLDECGEIVKFDLPSTALPKSGRMYAMVQFSTPESASTACSTLNGRRFACFGNERIRVAHLHSVSYIITFEIFVAIQPDLCDLQDLARWHKVQLLIVPKDSKGKTRVKLMGDRDLHILKKVKVPVERLLAGQKVQMKSGPVWDVYFGSHYGTEFIYNVACSTATFIRVDDFKGYITVWGTTKARTQAARQIIDKAFQLQSTRTFSIPFAPGTISRLLSADFLAIQDMVGEHNAELDLSERCLRIRGTSAQYRSVSALLHGKKSSAYDGDSPIVLTNETCPVCLSSVIESISLECTHKTCRSCLTRYISSSETHRAFPLKCLGDDATCPELLPASLCRRLLPADEFTKVVEASFRSYTAARPHEFRRCPSTNCAQVYRLENDSSSRPPQCPSCLIRVCPYCHEEEHRGYHCVGMVKEDERLYSQWKDAHDVHPCPNCHADIEKAAGCNHMTCSQCGTHICWVCLTTFANGSDVYQHMRDVHGGIG